MAKGTVQQKSGNTNKLLIVIIVLLVLIIGVGGFCVWKFVLSAPKEETSVNSTSMFGYDGNVIMNEDDVDLEAQQQKVDDGMIDLNFSDTMIVNNGKEVTCVIVNEDTNKYDMYVALVLSENNKEVYKSGLIPLGGRIEGFELPETLEVGKHEGILQYYQVKDNEVIGQVNVVVTLDVKS